MITSTVIIIIIDDDYDDDSHASHYQKTGNGPKEPWKETEGNGN